MYLIDDDLLEVALQSTDPAGGTPSTPVPFTQTPNVSQRGFRDLRFLVLHYTAGPSLEGAVRTLTSPERKASAHLVIGRDGAVHQLATFDQVTWHAGESSWKPAKAGIAGRLKGLNHYSIGIEMVNWGPLKQTAFGQFFSWSGARIENEDVVEVEPKAPDSFRRRFWHRYPEEQISAAIEISLLLCQHYRLEDILGHSDVAPARKTDPGPAFPMQHLRAILSGRA
jgi:N-acetylmuramoyl-L-alanine amidase